MTTSLRIGAITVGVLAVWAAHAPAVCAQAPDDGQWRQGTALSVFAGSASASSDWSAAAGAALAWELTPRLTIEGNGIWADGPRGSTSFAALLGSRVNLLPPRTVVPFASGGIGLYRASFGADTTSMPDFYHRRMIAGAHSDREFTDFAVAVGGGVDIFLQRHVALRPEVRILFAANDSSVRPVTFVGINLSYHFESHNVTPTRRQAQ